MRIVAEIPHPRLKISIFQWNAKYMIKLEAGSYEQVYKVAESDVSGLEDVKKMINDSFLDRAMIRFSEMSKDWAEAFQSV